jgi:hypothetical protein
VPRPFFPHTLSDLIRNVDGALGLVVGDMPDHSIWILKRDRRRGDYALTHFANMDRRDQLHRATYDDRAVAINAMAAAIGLVERL